MRFAVLGDLHGSIDQDDVRWLDRQDLAAVLVCGDLGGFRPGSETAVAQVLSRLTTRTLVAPGNHDAVTMPQLGAEVMGQHALADRLASGMDTRVEALRADLGPADLGGYSVHAVGEVRVVVGRPHTFGGPTLTVRGRLRDAFGVTSLQDSEERLLDLLRQAAGHPVVVLAHNGPAGLGTTRDAPCGRDFHRDEGDWGDPDLAAAIQRARAERIDVRAVVFGHLHHNLSGGGTRRPFGLLDGVPCANAAKVPRRARDGWRHHVEVTLEGPTTRVEAVRWRDGVVHRATWFDGTVPTG